MFENPYHFKKLFEKKKSAKFLMSTTTYIFETSKNAYLINAEHYRDGIFVIKYFLKKNKNNNKKYNLLTNEGACPRIIATCLHVMLSILKKHPKANFGFLGAHTVNLAQKYEEPRENTKRFRIYKYAIEAYFGTDAFTHFENIENSTYLVINNNIDGDIELVAQKANDMFLQIYPSLEGV